MNKIIPFIIKALHNQYLQIDDIIMNNEELWWIFILLRFGWGSEECIEILVEKIKSKGNLYFYVGIMLRIPKFTSNLNESISSTAGHYKIDEYFHPDEITFMLLSVFYIICLLVRLNSNIISLTISSLEIR